MLDYSATPSDLYHGSPENRRETAPSRAFPTVAAALAAVLVASAAIGGRESLVRIAPALAPVYAAAGLPALDPLPTIEDVSSTLKTEDATKVLIVMGKIVNHGSGAQSAPDLRISILGADGRSIYYWVAPAAKSRLASGEAVSFKARLAAPPAEGQSVAVRFAEKGDNPWSDAP